MRDEAKGSFQDLKAEREGILQNEELSIKEEDQLQRSIKKSKASGAENNLIEGSDTQMGGDPVNEQEGNIVDVCDMENIQAVKRPLGSYREGLIQSMD